MARSQGRGRGNSPADEEFVEWMAENGGLEPISPDAEDLSFPVKVRWTGKAEDEGSPWVLPPPGKRCVGTAYVRDADGDYVVDKDNVRIQRPCHRWPIKGGKVCTAHGGGIIRVRKAAIERMANALDAVTGELVRTALGSRDDNARVKAITAIMDRVGVRAGVDVQNLSDPEYLNVLRGIFDSKAPPAEPDEGADVGD